MKNVIVVGSLMLGLGVAIGWLAKPVPLPVATPVIAAAAPAKPVGDVVTTTVSESSVPGKRAQREPVVKKPDGMPTKEQMSQAKKMQVDMFEAMGKRQRDKFEKHIARLSENLTLTDEQKAKLNTWLDERMKKLDEMDITDPKSMEGMTASFKELTNKGLEEQLAPFLSADQKTAFADFKDREHRSKVDTAALKSLTTLQGVIEFEDGQRDEVYKALTEAAESTVVTEDEAPDISKMMTEGMGIEMDPYNLGLQKAMTDAMTDPSMLAKSGNEKKQMVSKIRETFDKRIEDKVEQLRPVLNDKQLDLYRNELKTKGMGVYGTVLSSMENAGD
ncbi:MAG: hypothetical protein ABI162_17620 [Luteolibacter sp.]